MAIVQHHDAIAGTAKQHVNEDYTLRIWNAIRKNSVVLREIMGEFVSEAEWEQCSESNVTYVKCPTREFKGAKEGFSMDMAIFNPTTGGPRLVKVLVPHSKIAVISKTTGEQLESEVLCHFE